jgi:p-aminobenzoyl-glutamate transporter AbgT
VKSPAANSLEYDAPVTCMKDNWVIIVANWLIIIWVPVDVLVVADVVVLLLALDEDEDDDEEEDEDVDAGEDEEDVAVLVANWTKLLTVRVTAFG